MKKTELWLLVVIIVLLFQITRNINLMIYTGILLFAYIGLYTTYIYESIKTRGNILFKVDMGELIFIFGSISIPIISLLYLPINEYFIALPRYLVTFPFIIFSLFYYNWNAKIIEKIYKSYVYFIMLSSLSIFYQVLFGPIYFFAEPSRREGLVRYASLAGSLTALGTLGAYALAILLFDKRSFFKRQNIILQIIIILGMGMSLQKAAIANILVVYGIKFLLKTKRKISKIILLILSLIIILTILNTFYNNNVIYIYLRKIILYTFNSNSQTGTNQDVLDRILKYPKVVLIYNSIKLKDLFLGIGFKALSGTMGLSNYPMAHNNFVDVFLLGGIFFWFNYLILLIRNFFKNNNLLEKVLCFLFLLNMLIGAATLYQPVSCVIMIVVIISYKKYFN